MMRATRDVSNTTYQLTLDRLFEPDGSLKPFQKAKYEPKVRRLRSAGLGNADPILDVGIGYGAWLSLLERSGFENLHGMDPFEGSIDLAGHRTRAKLRLGRIEDEAWPYEERSFATITCFEVVEHLEEPPVFFQRVRRYLRPDGLALITTPLLEVGYRLRNFPVIGIPDTNPTHINVKPPDYWLGVVRRSGFRVVEAWRGETLTHVRLMNHVGTVVARLGVDHRRVPGLRQFEQSFCVLFRP